MPINLEDRVVLTDLLVDDDYIPDLYQSIASHIKTEQDIHDWVNKVLPVPIPDDLASDREVSDITEDFITSGTRDAIFLIRSFALYEKGMISRSILRKEESYDFSRLCLQSALLSMHLDKNPVGLTTETNLGIAEYLIKSGHAKTLFGLVQSSPDIGMLGWLDYFLFPVKKEITRTKEEFLAAQEFQDRGYSKEYVDAISAVRTFSHFGSIEYEEKSITVTFHQPVTGDKEKDRLSRVNETAGSLYMIFKALEYCRNKELSSLPPLLPELQALLENEQAASAVPGNHVTS